MIADDQSKKKPGRPKKQASSAPIELHGLVQAPANAGDIAELVYCNPAMFKKLLQLYKQFEVSEVELHFDETGLRITAQDHLGKSNIYTTIDGRCMNLYFCKTPVRICVKRDNLERVLGTLSKNHYKIAFILKENYRSTLYLIIKDTEYDNENSYEVDVVFKPEGIGKIASRDVDDAYPIRFKLSSRHFKALINNAKKLSPVITLQKAGDDPLQFTFARAQKVNWTGVYSDPEKIELVSTLAADEIFSVSMNIDYVRPLSNSNIGDEVRIAAHHHEKMSFTTFLDKKEAGHACCVKIFTEVKDYRRDVGVAGFV